MGHPLKPGSVDLGHMGPGLQIRECLSREMPGEGAQTLQPCNDCWIYPRLDLGQNLAVQGDRA
jgi:hypothetical protein